MMAPQYSHRNAVAAIAIGIAVTLVSVMGQSNNNSCSDERWFSRKKLSFVYAQNFSEVSNSTKSFPLNTTLLVVCKNPEVNQFKQPVSSDLLFGKCTANNKWKNQNDDDWDPPSCVKRQNHCQFPPGVSNAIIRIDGRNIDNMTSLNYSENTAAIYKCKMKNDSQEWRCNKKKKNTYLWEKANLTAKDLVCEDDNDNSSARTVSSITVTPATLNTPASKPTYGPQINDDIPPPPDSGGGLSLRDFLIGIFSFLGFVMIAVLFGVLYKNTTRLGKRYNDTADHERQPPFTSMSEEKNKLKEKFDDGEENLQYVNIIPIKVNQETIYAEVETGKIGKSRPTMKLTIDDDQLHTTYAEIHHSVIPKDQRR